MKSIRGVEIMLNQTYEAIVKAIQQGFDQCEVLIDLPKEGRNTPYFYITVVNPSQEPRLGNQYQRIQPFEIQYFPKSESYTTECMEVAEKLFDMLEYILVGEELVKGSNMNLKLEEGILYFYVQFNAILVKQRNSDSLMQDLETRLGVKKGE